MIYVLVLIALAIVASVLLGRQRRVRLKASCRGAFARIYAASSPPPSFEMAFSYGEPTFRIQFASQADMAAHADANHGFLLAIDELCRSTGRKDRPFKAQRAVFFTHPEKEEVRRAVHCCAQMHAQANQASPAFISYSAGSRAYELLAHDADGSRLRLIFCPWCGTKLPALHLAERPGDARNG